MNLTLLAALILPLRLVFFSQSVIAPFVPPADWLHEYFLRYLNAYPSKWNWFYAAITIGHDDQIRTKEPIAAFIALGLYHLVVVSGAHLNCLEIVLKKIFNSRTLLLTCLVVFTMANRWEPACSRALVHWLLTKLRHDQNSYSPLPTIESTLLCLILEPAWAGSLSFQLSVAASLGVLAGKSLTSQFLLREFITILFVTLLTLPFLAPFASCVHWVAIPANAALRPLLEFILFPTSLILSASGPLKIHFDGLFSIVLKPIEWLGEIPFPVTCLESRRQTPWALFFIFLYFGVFLSLLPQVIRRRIHTQQSRFSM